MVPLTTPPSGIVTLAPGFGGRATDPALVTDDLVLTYADLAVLVHEAVAWLGPGRRLLALEAGNDIGTVVWYLAALAGHHPVLVCPAGSGSGLVERYDPDVVVQAGQPTLRHRQPAHDLHPDLAVLLSTSGSTGSPRLVRLSADNVVSNAEAIAAYLGLDPGDRGVTSLPLHYCYGLSVLTSHLQAGASVALTGASVVDPCFWALFGDASVTGLAGVPHTFALLDRIGFDSMSLPSLRYLTQAGGRMAPDAVRRHAELAARRGWDLYVMYGQTEATARMAYLPPELATRHPQAVGVAIPGGSITIEPVPECDLAGHGELVYRGPNVMLGYAEGPADLALGRTVHELHTGDLGTRNADGLLEITGRRSRFAKLYGVRIDLASVESHLGQAGVEALCASDDDRLCVAVDAGADVSAVAARVRQLVDVPASALHVVAVAELPRLASGKPDHQAVAALLHRQDEPLPAGTDVRRLYAQALGIDVNQISGADSFVSLGGDSLSYVELSLALEDVVGPLPRAWHLSPIADLVPPDGPPPPRRWRRVDASVALRAVAIVLIVGNHVGLFFIPGGAHVLLAVAGYNVARFSLTGGSLWPSIARIAVPSVAWIGLLAATTERFTVANALLVNTFIGPPGSPWNYWFIETLVLFLVGLGVATAIPAVRRFERRRPFAAPAAVLGVGLAIRFDLLDLPTRYYWLYRPHEVLWLFALGWATARADGRQRVVLTAVAIAATWGFSPRPTANAVIGAGVLALLWCRNVAVPRPVAVAVTTVAASSLATYLVHSQVHPLLTPYSRLLALVASLVAGIVAWRLGGWAVARLKGLASGWRIAGSSPTSQTQDALVASLDGR